MERIKALIDKLYTQKNSGAGTAQLLVTVQLLQVELVEAEKTPQKAEKGRISVILPFKAKLTETPPVAVDGAEDPGKVIYALEEEPQERLLKEDDEPFFYPSAEAEEEKPAVQAQPTAASPQKKETASVVAQPVPAEEAPKGYVLRKPAIAEPLSGPVAEAGAVQLPPERTEEPAPASAGRPPADPISEEYHYFDAVMETPTLAQHQPQKEVQHQLIINDTPSLNDKLKQEGMEIAHRLTAAPIKDLRKGIGINDRFTFVSNLFRGDDAMYERSIKTINNFGALAEAEYWISRELKYKLGWSESSETVQHFYSLVKRRFA